MNQKSDGKLYKKLLCWVAKLSMYVNWLHPMLWWSIAC